MTAMARHTHSCNLIFILAAVLWAGHALAVGTTDAAASDVGSAMAVASTAAEKQGELSACAKQCFAVAQSLGFDQVAADSLACYMPYKRKRLSTYDCCDKAELLLGAQGTLANCLCCPEFANAMLGAVPYATLGTTANDYLDKLQLCRVPTLARSTCPASQSLELTRSQALLNASAAAASNLTGMSPVVATQGPAVPVIVQPNRIVVVGSSPVYDDFLTGFVKWIEQEVPRYNHPKVPDLPPLPPQSAADVQWVADLRRGPYPDLVKKRPAKFSPKATDPLQNGVIATLPPGPAYAGVLSRGVPGAAPTAP